MYMYLYVHMYMHTFIPLHMSFIFNCIDVDSKIVVGTFKSFVKRPLVFFEGIWLEV